MSLRTTVVVGGDGSGLALARTLESLLAAASGPVEILLAPDPTDDTRRHALWKSMSQRFGAPLVSVRAEEGWRDAGGRAARGDLLLLLRPGERLAVGSLDRARELLEADPGADFVSAWTRVETAHDADNVEVPLEIGLPTVLGRPDAVPRAALLRRSLFEEVEGFSGAPPGLEEWSFWIAVLARGARGAHLEEALLTTSLERAGGMEVPAEALESLYEQRRSVFEAHPAALLEAQERAIRSLVPAHDRLEARRGEAAAELARLQGEVERLRATLRESGEDAVDWGDLGRPVPLSRDWGYERGREGQGKPVDRHAIERFLESCADDVRGVVLEVQEDDYTRRFGGDRVTRSDVVDVDPANRRATVLADLRDARSIPDETYDCFIFTQTLHVLDDMRAALREAWRILKPGGVLLATLPCTSRVCLEYGSEGDFWRVTEAGARRLFAEVFPEGAFETRGWGNVLSSAAFLYGAACDELSAEQLDAFDPFFPLLVSVRAVKPGGPSTPPPVGARHRPRARIAPPAPGALVLMYHRVTERALDAHGLCVSPADFAEQMGVLREEWDPVPLSDLAAAAARGRSLSGAVAVTLDDGYADALHQASPILSSLSIPATFFVTSGALDDPSAFWWDTLERVLLTGTALPEVLEIELAGERVCFATAAASERRAAHERLHEAFVRGSREERARLLSVLLQWSDAPPPPRETDRPLNPKELLRLASRPGHAIGAHTVSHLALSHQPPDVVDVEVREGRRALEEVLGRSVESFAYPYGDVTEAAVEAVRAAGFACAVTCEARLVIPGDDPLRLPRIEAGPGGREAFQRLLRGLATAR